MTFYEDSLAVHKLLLFSSSSSRLTEYKIRSIKNFWNTYKGIVDSWVLYYNGPEQNILVASGEDEKIDIKDESLYNTFMKGLNK